MSWAVLRPQVKTVLEGISTLYEVSNVPKLKFSGYPAAYVVPSGNTGDYETTTENIRSYSFIVRVFYETKQTGIADAIAALEEVVDSVIDAFDQEDIKPGSTRTLGISLPAAYTYINVWATPSAWLELPEEQLIMAEITVRIRLSVDIT